MSTHGERFVEEVLRRLSASSGVGEAIARIEREAAAGEPSALLELHAALARPPPPLEAPVARSVQTRIEHVLALTPRAESLEACLTLARTNALTGTTLRGFAARLAQGQLPSELLNAMAAQLGDEGLRELLACVLHELVARGMDCTGEEAAEALQRVLAQERHPLSWLPLTRAELERDCVPCTFSPGGSSLPLPRIATPEATGARRDEPVSLQLLEDEVLEGRLAAAVEGWRSESNGTIETGVLIAERGGLDPDTVGPRFLGSLGLGSVDGDETRIWPVGPERVMECLFAAAASGGAYGGGAEHAYGRLLAWTSLNALCGGAAERSFADAVEQVERAALFEYETGGSWFARVAWDLAFVGLTPTRDRVLVLAATDTD